MPPRKTKAQRRKNRHLTSSHKGSNEEQCAGEDYYESRSHGFIQVPDSAENAFPFGQEQHAAEHTDASAVETFIQSDESQRQKHEEEDSKLEGGSQASAKNSHRKGDDSTNGKSLSEVLDLPNSHVLANKQNIDKLTHRELRRLSKSQRKKLEKLKRNKEKEKMRGEVLKSLKSHSLSDDQLMLMRKSGLNGQRMTMKEHLQREMQKKKLGLDYTDDYLARKADIEDDPLATEENTGEGRTTQSKSFEIVKPKRQPVHQGDEHPECSPSYTSTSADVLPKELNRSHTTVAETSTMMCHNLQSEGTDENGEYVGSKMECNAQGEATDSLSKLQQLRAKNARLAKMGMFAVNAEWTPTERKKHFHDVDTDVFAASAEQQTDSHVHVSAVKKCSDNSDPQSAVSNVSTDRSNTRDLDASSKTRNKDHKTGSDISFPRENKGSENISAKNINAIQPEHTVQEGSEHPNKKSKSSTRCVYVKRNEEVQEDRMKLPVCQMEQEIMEKIMDNDVVVLCGETGSGKTTQVPQFLYEYGYGLHGRSIAVTQPRRVAAVSTSHRVSFELGSSKSKKNPVGYQIRFDSGNIGKHTRIKFLTDGILLREIQEDLILRKYSAILIDEAHERNLNTDVLVGLLSRALKLRNEIARSEEELSKPESERITPLKLVIMSATLRVDDFAKNSNLFAPAPPVIHVTSRQFPVTIHFSKRTELENYIGEAEKKICRMHRKLPDGGILVFLTGQDEIEHLCKKLKTKLQIRKRKVRRERSMKGSKRQKVIASDRDASQTDIITGESYIETNDSESEAEDSNEEDEADDFTSVDSDSDESMNELEEDTEETEETAREKKQAYILPLYAALPQSEQAKVFQPPPPGHRLIVVSTNVAETSLTIPNIRYVVDSGRVKRKVYSGRSGISHFEVGWISKSSAEQRAGRAGRTQAGHSYRLYSSAVFDDQFPQFEAPEIECMPITNMVLQLKAMGITNIQNFPFPSPPPESSLKRSLKSLINLGALTPVFRKRDESKQVTELTWQNIRHQLASVLPENYKSAADTESLALNTYFNEPLLSKEGADHEVLRQFLKRVSLPIVEGEKLTSLGRAISLFPVPPHLAKVIVFAATSVKYTSEEQQRIQDFAILLASLTSVDNVFIHSRGQPVEKEQNEESSEISIHDLLFTFHDSQSDILTNLNVAGAFLLEYACSKDRAEHFCSKYNVKFKTLVEVLKFRDQLWQYIDKYLPEQTSPDKLYRRSIAASSSDRVEDEDDSKGETRQFARSNALLSEPPSEGEKKVLRQLLCAGSIERVAKRATPDEASSLLKSIGCERKKVKKGNWVPYICCDRNFPSPIFVHSSSVVAANRVNKMPEWVVFEEVISNRSNRAFMKGVTAINSSWLPELAVGTPLLRHGEPLESPLPHYDAQRDEVVAYAHPYYGDHQWELTPYPIPYPEEGKRLTKKVALFAQALVDGQVFAEIKKLDRFLIKPKHLTTAHSQHNSILSCLLHGKGNADRPICSAKQLKEVWAFDEKFLKPQFEALLRDEGKQLFASTWASLTKTSDKSASLA